MSVRFEVDNHVARVTIDRPDRLNAVDAETEAALIGAWEAIERDDDVRCVVLTGAGDRAFCAGADLGTMGKTPVPPEFKPGVIDRLGRLPQPVIAAVHGVCYTGGLELALACDFIIADPGARFAEDAGVDLVFAPDATEMYPIGAQTIVEVGALAAPLCGASRPGHFRGVATVVAKLLVAAKPHVAVFGENDYQQLAVIRRLARDLLIDVEIVGAPTVREPDGLALSSRNRHLDADARRHAEGALKVA